MFSGIIEQKAKIISINNGEIIIENTFTEELNIWQSIAHDWACMTITKFDNEKCKNLKNILSKKRDSRYANKNRRIVNKDWKDFNNYQ